MKYLLWLILILPLNLYSQEGDTNLEVFLFGKSYHTNREVDYREVNPGVAVGLAYAFAEELDLLATVGTYKDSYNDNAKFALLGFRIILGEREGIHATLGGSLGYVKGSSMNGFGGLPIVSIGYNWVDICMTGDWAAERKDETYHNADGSINTRASITNSVAFFLKLNVVKF